MESDLKIKLHFLIFMPYILNVVIYSKKLLGIETIQTFGIKLYLCFRYAVESHTNVSKSIKQQS